MTTTTAPLTAGSQEATMSKLCKCGCGTEISENNNWEYKRGHKPGGAKKKKSSSPKPRAKAEDADVNMVTLSIDMSEAKLDQIWARLDIGSKGAAIQVALGIED
jgi:hypothetical protein